MSHAQVMQGGLCAPMLWLRGICLGMCLYLWSAGTLAAQVFNVNTPQDSVFIGVGADSTDYVAQDFIASVKRVRKIGVWLQRLAGTGEVRISLVKDNGINQPNLNFVLHESVLIQPDTTGGWVYDSTFSAVLTPGQKYWIVVDGYQNLLGTGYAAVGSSHIPTNSGGPIRYSTDGGLNWPSQQGMPMALVVEGDNCTFGLTMYPAQPLLCPDGTVTFGVQNGFVSYLWAGGQTSSSITVNALGLYTVQAVDTANCTSTASVVVVQGTIPFTNLLNFYDICASAPLQLSVPPFYSTYTWSDGTVGLYDTISTDGTYWVSITSNSGCSFVDSFVVHVRPFASYEIGADSGLCAGDTVFLSADAGYVHYLWSTGRTGRFDTLVATTSAWVQIIDSAGCFTESDTVEYSFYPLPAVPTIQLLPAGLHCSFANTYAWWRDGQPLAGQTSQDIPDPLPGLYNITIGNAYGCTAVSDTLRVVGESSGTFVSGGFSPNGDGVNDLFFVEGISRYPALRLQVFNRWGDEVYLAYPYRNDWDGTGKQGHALPVGDYYYILDFGDARETLRGTVLLSR